MSAGARILLIEDDPGIRENLRRVLAEEGHEVAVEARGDAGLAHAARAPFNVVITDLKLPGLNGLDLVRQLHVAQPRLPIILVTAFGTTETAIEATKSGAYDYVLKPFDVADLIELVRKAADSNRLMSEPVLLGGAGAARSGLVGQSAAMQAIYKEVGRVASKPVNVLIRGETGTGKELIARALYQHSDRANAPFIAINCAAIPETLLESELFGHERGAFTGADKSKPGLFEVAHGGTIFLDEIGEISQATQVNLLRVLDTSVFRHVGGTSEIRVDVRVLAATNRDLRAMVSKGLFREDLFYRMSTITVEVPPLRNRGGDIELLARHFVKVLNERYGTGKQLSAGALDALSHHSWPGNVRELLHAVEAAAVVCEGPEILAGHLPAPIRAGAVPSQPAPLVDGGRLPTLVELEIIHIRRALETCRGHRGNAARMLGISERNLYRKLKEYRLLAGQIPDLPRK